MSKIKVKISETKYLSFYKTLVLPNSRGDVHVEGGGDEDRGGEAEEEQKGEVVHDELI